MNGAKAERFAWWQVWKGGPTVLGCEEEASWQLYSQVIHPKTRFYHFFIALFCWGLNEKGLWEFNIVRYCIVEYWCSILNNGFFFCVAFKYRPTETHAIIIRFHHGGLFIADPQSEYIRGQVYVLMCRAWFLPYKIWMRMLRIGCAWSIFMVTGGKDILVQRWKRLFGQLPEQIQCLSHPTQDKTAKGRQQLIESSLRVETRYFAFKLHNIFLHEYPY